MEIGRRGPPVSYLPSPDRGRPPQPSRRPIPNQRGEDFVPHPPLPSARAGSLRRRDPGGRGVAGHRDADRRRALPGSARAGDPARGRDPLGLDAGSAWAPGIAFSAKVLLEVAVVLLGASVSAATVLALGPALDRRHRARGRARHRVELRPVPPARPAEAHGRAGRLRQLHLRQLRHRGRGAGDRGGRRRRRLLDRLHGRAGRDRGAAPAAAGAGAAAVADPIRRAGRPHRLCRAAGAGGDAADRRAVATRSARW